jgi:hypothetical protein
MGLTSADDQIMARQNETMEQFGKKNAGGESKKANKPSAKAEGL